VNNIAFLELKYGNIYGGYPNFYAISEIALLVFEPDSKKIFLESWNSNADVDIVNVYAKVNELGHTMSRVREVMNIRSRRRKVYKEDFRLPEEELKEAFNRLRGTRSAIKSFFMRNLRKYRFRDMITFDGRRDVFLCEKSGARFDRYRIVDLQKEINQETNYLFSLNKLSVVINFEHDMSYLRSNNLEYWLHPIAARQIIPKSAAYDAVRLLMVHQEYREHKQDFLIQAARLLQKIENSKVDQANSQ